MMDLYIFMPLRLSNLNQSSVDIYLTLDWSIGLAVLSLFYGIILLLPVPTTLYRDAIIQFKWNHLVHLDIVQTTRSIILPVTLGLLSIILFPGLLTLATIHLLGKK